MNINNQGVNPFVLYTPGSANEKVNIYDLEITVSAATTVYFLSTDSTGSFGSQKVLASYNFQSDGGIVSPPGKHYKGTTNPGESLTLFNSGNVQINGRLTGILEIAGQVI